MTTPQVAAILALEQRLEASKSRNYGHVVSGIASDAIALCHALVADAERWRNLYESVNRMMSELGKHGSISTRDTMVTAVMDALHEIDGGTYKVTDGGTP